MRDVCQEVKVDRFAAGVETLGYRYTAAVVETYGRWNKAGARIVRKTIHALAAAKHISKSAASIRVNQRLSCALWRRGCGPAIESVVRIPDGGVGRFDGIRRSGWIDRDGSRLADR